MDGEDNRVTSGSSLDWKEAVAGSFSHHRELFLSALFVV